MSSVVLHSPVLALIKGYYRTGEVEKKVEQATKEISSLVQKCLEQAQKNEGKVQLDESDGEIAFETRVKWITNELKEQGHKTTEPKFQWETSLDRSIQICLFTILK